MTKRHKTLLWSLALSGALSFPAQAQLVLQGSNGSATPLHPIVMTPKKVRTLGLESSVRMDYVSSKNQYFILAYDRVPTATAQKVMEQVGTYVAYLPENIYIYKAANADKAAQEMERLALGDGLKVLGKGTLPLQFKLSQQLYRASLKQEELPLNIQEKGLEVSVFEQEDLGALKQTFANWGLNVKDNEDGGVIVTSHISLSLAKQIAALPYVLAVREHITAQPEMLHMNHIMRTNSASLVNYDNKGATGKGVYFMNWERYGSQDFEALTTYGRTLPHASDHADNAHGSNCGNIAAGANNVDEWEGGGMAPGATYLAGGDHTYYANSGGPGVERALRDGYTPIVANHSVGWSYGLTDYWPQAANVDRITLESNSFISCYSAGNASEGPFPPYTINGYGSYSGGIKSNKNGFNVHSVAEPTIDVDWASFGPSKDGRLNPQICAQGTGGTSYASPGVAGMVAILMDQYRQTYNTAPRADVVKAVIMNTAIPVRTFTDKKTGKRIDAVNYINYRTGFGQINPTAAVAAVKEQRVKFGEKVGQGETKVVELNVPENQAELRFMLYWNDLPGTPGATKQLINDLDIVVEDPDGTTYLPWTLDPSPAKVTEKPVRKENHLDNAEQVVIRAASKNALLKGGTYKVYIKGYKIPNAAKKPEYVLTWQFRPRGIIMTSIPEGYRVNNDDDLMVTWDLTLAEDEDAKALNPTSELPNPGNMTPKMYYRTSSTGKWMLAPRSVGRYGKNYAYYRVPSFLRTSELQFEIRVDDLTQQSNKAMVERRIVARPSIVAFSPEKVKLTWQAARNVKNGKYYIHALYDKHMTIVDSADIATTEKEVAAPAGSQWKTNNLFAISVYNADTKARSQRSLPVGLDQSNKWAVGNDNEWAQKYDLCAADVKTLRTLTLEGDIRWYKKVGVKANPIPDEEKGNARYRDFYRADVGTYFYTITASEATDPYYTSPEVVFTAPGVEPEDSAIYGDGHWAGYVFTNPDGGYSSSTLLKPNSSLYGKFVLNHLGFDSDADNVLFKWKEPSVTKISGYIGCDPGGNRTNRVIVLKRKNFKRGTYTFTVKRASVRARVIFRNRLGGIINSWTSSVNFSGSHAINVQLDENSTCEIHWIGDHFVMDVETPPYVTPIFTGLESGKYYRITNALPKFYEVQGVTKGLYLRNKDKRAAWETTDKTNASQLWKITTNTAYPSVSIANANLGLYLNLPNGVAKEEPSVITLSELGQSQFNLLSGTSAYYAGSNFNGKGVQGVISSVKQALNSAAAWYLELAESIQLRVNEKGYASACYPFAVRVLDIPHFAVYSVAGFDANGHTLKGAKFAPNAIVPANTPIIIAAIPAIYDMPIEPSNTDAATTSLLKGIAPDEKISGNVYVLGYDPAQGLGFVPASSAYAFAGATETNRVSYTAPASAGNFVPLVLSPVTGIGHLNDSNTEKSTLHDAAGRQLQGTPQRGFYIHNGQKVVK